MVDGLAYAGPAIVLSMMTFALVVYIPAFYATEAGLSLASVGAAFFVARLWDAIIDPGIGHLSDNSRSRWGRRKPWIAAGVPLLLFGAWWLFAPGAGQVSVLYLLITIFLFYIAWTAVQIPYLSWGAELSDDYAERSRIVGMREAGTFVGVLVATGVPVIVFTSGDPSIGEILELFLWMSLLILPATALFMLVRLQERPRADLATPTLQETLRALKRNRAFLRLTVACFLLWLGLHIYNAGVLLVIQFLLELPTSIFLRLVFVQFAVGLAATPLIIWLANRWGKHKTLGLTALLVSLSLPLLALIPIRDTFSTIIVFAVLGLTISPIWILPTSLVADAVDLGRVKGGGDQSGVYMAIYNLSMKLALAVSVGIALPLMQWLGFDPESGAGVDALSAITLFLPAAIWCVSAWLFFTYPLDQRRHAVVRRWLERPHFGAAERKSLELK